jgi:hypothetical protein
VFLCSLLVCLIPTFGKTQVRANAYHPTHDVIHKSVSSEMLFLKYVLVRDFSINVNCDGSGHQIRSFLRCEKREVTKPFCADNSRPQDGSVCVNPDRLRWQLRSEGVFPNANIAPISYFICGSLTSISDLSMCYRAIWVDDSGIGFRSGFAINWKWIGDINYGARFRHDISSLLSLRRLSGKNSLYNENYKTNPSSENSPNSCPQITTSEFVERICLSLFFFAFSMWMFYWAAIKAFLAGKNGLFIGCLLLGCVCFFLTIKFDDSATFGCGGWRSFFCDYNERQYRDNTYRDEKQFHIVQDVQKNANHGFLPTEICTTVETPGSICTFASIFSWGGNRLLEIERSSVIAARIYGCSVGGWQALSFSELFLTSISKLRLMIPHH